MTLRQARQKEPFQWLMTAIGEDVTAELLSRSTVDDTSTTAGTSEDMVVDTTIGTEDPGRFALSMSMKTELLWTPSRTLASGRTGGSGIGGRVRNGG